MTDALRRGDMDAFVHGPGRARMDLWKEQFSNRMLRELEAAAEAKAHERGPWCGDDDEWEFSEEEESEEEEDDEEEEDLVEQDEEDAYQSCADESIDRDGGETS